MKLLLQMLVAPLLGLLCSCGSSSPDEDSSGTSGVWSSVATTSSTLTVTSAANLIVNSPFYGLKVTRNGIDITDAITDITTLSPTSWRYTFQGQTLNTPGDTIAV